MGMFERTMHILWIELVSLLQPEVSRRDWSRINLTLAFAPLFYCDKGIGMEMSSSSTTKLTDLSLMILARIVELVGKAFRTKEGIFDRRNLPMVQPLKTTCWLLHKATSLAIGALWLDYSYDTGLRIKSREYSLPDHSASISLDFVLSLPCLHELQVTDKSLPSSFARAFEVIPGLKRIELRETDENSTVRFKAFKSASTVERLDIWGLGGNKHSEICFRFAMIVLMILALAT